MSQETTIIRGFTDPVVLKLGLKTQFGDQFYRVFLDNRLVAIVDSNRLSATQKLMARRNTFSEPNQDNVI